jgi:hypothetical protein
MNKLIIFVFALLTGTAHGQWYIGGKAAAAFSRYKSKTPWTEAANTGYSLGLTSTRQINADVAVNIELEYIRKGYLHKVCNTITDALNTTYVEVPVMIDYAFDIRRLKNFRTHITGGVYGAYWLSGKYKTQGFDNVGEENFDFRKNKASHLDFGPNVGFKIEYILPNGSLSLDFRFEKGLIDMEKLPTDNTSNTNQTMLIGLSYKKLMGIL